MMTCPPTTDPRTTACAASRWVWVLVNKVLIESSLSLSGMFSSDVTLTRYGKPRTNVKPFFRGLEKDLHALTTRVDPVLSPMDRFSTRCRIRFGSNH